MTGSLLQMSGVVADIVMEVAAPPPRGGEAVARAAALTAGGGFNAMAAARRSGMRVAYGGALGRGRFADIARAALEAEGIEILQTAPAAGDQGVCVVMVEPGGERSFVSHAGAESRLTDAMLARVEAESHDLILLSGYALAHEPGGAALERWLSSLSGGRLILDPSPVAALIPPARRAAALAKAAWVSCNAAEALALCGEADPAAAAARLAAGRPGGAVVRAGARGCWIAAGGAARHVGGLEVEAVDTTGAGDAHIGAFAAALAAGAAPEAAARRANAAAALSVTRRGPATAPTAVELAAFLAARDDRGGAAPPGTGEGDEP